MQIIGILGNAGSGKDTVGKMLVELTEGVSLALANPLKEFAQDVFGFTHSQLWGPSEARNAIDANYSRDPSRGWLRRLFSTELSSRARLSNWHQARYNLEAYGPNWIEEVLPDADPGESMGALTNWFNELPTDALTPRVVLQTLGTEFGRKQDPDVWIKVALVRAKAFLSEPEFVTTVCITDVRFLNEARLIRESGGQVWRIRRPGVSPLTTGIAGHASEEEQKKQEMDSYVTLDLNNRGTLAELYQNVKHAMEVLDP